MKADLKGAHSAAISKSKCIAIERAGEAESICRDISQSNQTIRSLRLLQLSITDQFTGNASDRYAEARDTFQRLQRPLSENLSPGDYG